MRSRIPFLTKRGELPAQGNSPLADFARLAAQFQNTFVPPESIDRYNEELKVYFSKYEKYRGQLLEWETQLSLTGPLRLILSNSGNAPASQIDVMLTFPDDVLLLEKDDLPKKPEAPRAPRKPATNLSELMSPGSFDPFSPQFLSRNLYQPPALPRDGEPDIDSGGHKVSFAISTLKHLFDFTLTGVYFCFPAREAMRSYQVQYHVSAAELPEAIAGSLHIVLDDVERDTHPTRTP